jgi:hypothetical protein
MIALFASWIVANMAMFAALVLEWWGVTGVIAAGVILVSLLVALLIRDVAQEPVAKRRSGPLERERAPWGRAPRTVAQRVGTHSRRQAQAPS